MRMKEEEEGRWKWNMVCEKLRHGLRGRGQRDMVDYVEGSMRVHGFRKNGKHKYL